MQEFKIVDMTLRESRSHRGSDLSFREKLELAKLLEKVGVDVIDLGYVGPEQADAVTVRTIADTICSSTLSCPVGLDADDVERTWTPLSAARLPRLNVVAPTSTVQIEYNYHMKAGQLAARVAEQISACAALCPDVELTAEDATRSEPDFLHQLIAAAIRAGASTITLVDSAGRLLPEEARSFIAGLYDAVPELAQAHLSLQFRDDLGLAVANAVVALQAGATELRATFNGDRETLSMEQLANVMRQRGDALGISCRLNQTMVQRTCKQMEQLMGLKRNSQSAFSHIVNTAERKGEPSEEYSAALALSEFAKKITALGYEMGAEEMERLYNQFIDLASRKKLVYERDIEALIAETARQVAPTYHLISYVSNSGNTIMATASIKVERDGETLTSVASGDGPIDAAFIAIEQILGHHFELEDFQIQSVTEGHEAMGDTLVKLRNNGRLYSGRGLSTDIIGASIRAYLNAINKIVYEEKNNR